MSIEEKLIAKKKARNKQSSDIRKAKRIKERLAKSLGCEVSEVPVSHRPLVLPKQLREQMEREAEESKILAHKIGDNLVKDIVYDEPYEDKLVGSMSYKHMDKEITRECLKCDREFVARGKFVRTCNRCKQSDYRTDINWRFRKC